MVDIRKILVILVIAVLSAAFVFSLVEAVYPNPEYSDYCDEQRPMPARKLVNDCAQEESVQAKWDACQKEDGEAFPTYDQAGCVIDYRCDPCRQEYESARDTHAYIYFLITAIFGAIAIIVGLMLPSKRAINEWIGSGLLLGGVIIIFGGTIVTFERLHTFLRPIIMLIELILVIYLAYKLWGEKLDGKKK